MLYRMGEGVFPCASPLSKKKLLERDPSSKTMHADLPVHRVLSKLMKFGPKPKNSKTLRYSCDLLNQKLSLDLC
jgi:hypothetical protein